MNKRSKNFVIAGIIFIFLLVFVYSMGVFFFQSWNPETWTGLGKGLVITGWGLSIFISCAFYDISNI